MAAEQDDLKAYENYRQAKHLEAAAFHLKASQKAAANGEHQAADRHMLHFQLHRRALGLHKGSGVPVPIQMRLSGIRVDHEGFKGHPADQWLAGGKGKP